MGPTTQSSKEMIRGTPIQKEAGERAPNPSERKLQFGSGVRNPWKEMMGEGPKELMPRCS